MSITRCPTRPLLIAVVTLSLLAAPACSSTTRSTAPPVVHPSRPNIVFVLTDDQRWDTIDQMPWLSQQRDWATFSNSFVEDPQCCPSRATILTGRDTTHTGVQTLQDGANLDERTTVATLLHGAGYRTGMFGKYLNGYPFDRGLYVPPGWDTWNAYVHSTLYYDYVLNEHGKAVHYGSDPSSYSTDVLASKARQFITTTPGSKPLFLYLAFNAPHFVGAGWAQPARRDIGKCKGLAPLRPPSYNVVDRANSPRWVWPAEVQKDWIMDTERQRACEAMLDVDQQLASIVRTLRDTGRLQDTYLVFASDNGYQYAEHRLFGKGDLYEESIRVPLLVKGPGIAGQSISRLTSNLDWTPTMLDWARVEAPKGFLDGHSFAGNLAGRGGTSPDSVLLRGCRTIEAKGSAGDQEDAACGGYPNGFGLAWGLRTARDVYVEYGDGERELYDIVRDPYEMDNLAGRPQYAGVQQRLASQLAVQRRR